MKRKNIEIFLDTGIILIGLVLLVILTSDGIQLSLGDHVVGLRSYRNPLVLFIIIFSIRALVYGKPLSHLTSKLEGARGVWITVSVISVLIFIYLTSVNYLAASKSQEDLLINLENAEGFEPASSITTLNGKIALKYEGEYILEFRLPVGDTSKYSKIRFTFSKEKSIRSLTILNVIYEQSASGTKKGLSIVRIGKGQLVYDFPLIDDKFDTIRVILKSDLGKVDAEITDIALLSTVASDYHYFTSVLAVITAFMLLLPGLLIVSVLTFRNQSVTVLLYSLFAASLCYYFILYLLLELSFLLQFPWPGHLLFVAFLILIASLVYINFRQDRFDTLNNYIYSARIPFIIFIVVLLLLTAYISFDTLYPLQNVDWQAISGPKTFKAFNAHDNYFQYANGRVIAENLPFSAEYGDRRLIYMPEDREILPGVIYAVFRSIYSVMSPYIGNSYMTFTIFGVAMNLMVIFPIIALTRRYIDIKSEMFLIVLLFGNAVFIVQPSLTWFKFCGAALFLSAILILLRDRQNLQSWLLAGLVFGLAANMHAAVSIGIPLYFLWFVYQQGKETHFQPDSWLYGPLLLVGVFILVNLPWKLIKKYYLQDSIDLFATFFFAGHKINGSLLDSAVLFFNNIPLNEQISFRLDRLIQAFRLEELFKLPALLQEAGFREFFLQWTQYEIGYTVFLYYPLLLLLMVSFVAKSLCLQLPSTGVTSSGSPGMGRNSELKSLILIGLATQLVFVVSAFSFNHPPDVSWSQPFGVTILVYLGMMLILLQNRFLAGLLTAYVLFTYTRLYLAYQIIPMPG